MHIVCCTDTHYIMPTGVMLKSLFVANKDADIHVHVVVDNSVTERDRAALSSVCGGHIAFYTTEDIKCDFPNIGVTNKHVTMAGYYRLFLSQLLPDNIDKVIYLDGDMIVSDRLDELWNTDISQYAIGCVKDMDENPNLNRIDYGRTFGYFNSGMLLINLQYWRTHCLQDIFLQCMKEHGDKLIYHDQDVLNFVLYDKKQWLPLKYNVQNGFLFKDKYQLFSCDSSDELQEAQNHPAVIHYTLSKPWKRYSMSPYKSKFVEIRKMTQWASVEYKEARVIEWAKLKNILKLLLKYNTKLMFKSWCHKI